MSAYLKLSYDIEYDGTYNACRMDLYVDTAADLAGLAFFDGIKLLPGSSAQDIATGDLYILNGSGSWIKQPSSDININIPDYDQLENDVEQLQNDTSDISDRVTAIETTKAGLKFTPETSSPSLTNNQRIKFTAANSNNNVEILIGKLNSTTNYVQFYINGIDKGYITFDVSRNIDTWG